VCGGCAGVVRVPNLLVVREIFCGWGVGGGSQYHGQRDQNTMGWGFNIPWIGSSIYNGLGGQNTMGMRLYILWIRG
jgi:hypothetical protein